MNTQTYLHLGHHVVYNLPGTRPSLTNSFHDWENCVKQEVCRFSLEQTFLSEFTLWLTKCWQLQNIGGLHTSDYTEEMIKSNQMKESLWDLFKMALLEPWLDAVNAAMTCIDKITAEINERNKSIDEAQGLSSNDRNEISNSGECV
jgi:hypothetical protein